MNINISAYFKLNSGSNLDDLEFYHGTNVPGIEIELHIKAFFFRKLKQLIHQRFFSRIVKFVRLRFILLEEFFYELIIVESVIRVYSVNE